MKRFTALIFALLAFSVASGWAAGAPSLNTIDPSPLQTGHGNVVRWNDPALSVEEILEALSLTESGKELLEKAKVIWNSEREVGVLASRNESVDELLQRKIIFGFVSKTDAVLTRHYQPETNTEIRTRTVTVILRRNQKLIDQVLDLAHELIHALAPPTWDPYDPTLSRGRYIFALLEKNGGEIDAVTSECQVAGEIEKSFKFQTKRCDRYFSNIHFNNSHSGSSRVGAEPGRGEFLVNRAKIQKDFYRVGKWSFLVRAKLKEEAKMFPFLSQLEPELYSATGRAPYPAALIREYEEITKVACSNVRNRKKVKMERAIASVSGNAGEGNAKADTEQFLQSRCPEPDKNQVTDDGNGALNTPAQASASH